MLHPWSGVLAVEDEQTGDGRVIPAGVLTWADPPLPLGWLEQEQHGSILAGAFQIGTIDTLSRVGNEVRGSGMIDDATVEGAEVVRRMTEGSAPYGERFGVSIDPDDWAIEIVETGEGAEDELVLIASGAVRTPATWATWRPLAAAAGDPDPGEDGTVVYEESADSYLERYTRLRIRGATLCAIAAFSTSYVGLDGEAAAEDDTEAEAEPEVVAASAAPSRPPAAWFAMPEPDDDSDLLVVQEDGQLLVPLTILDTGQVFGHVAGWNTCHTGYLDRCVRPPQSPSGYAVFHIGDTTCDDGTRVATGALVIGCDHASQAVGVDVVQARDHYANTGLGWADVRVTAGRFGPWASGTLRPDVTAAQADVLRRLGLSGDWRPLGSGHELVAVQAVNVPGFPIQRAALAASGLPQPADLRPPTVTFDGDRVGAIVAAGVVQRCPDCASRQRSAPEGSDLRVLVDEVLSAVSATRAMVATLERRTRSMNVEAAQAIRARAARNGS